MINIKKLGLSWGDFSISEFDWMFILIQLELYRVKSVVEFGSGVSTVLFADVCKRIVSYEKEVKWHSKVNRILTDTGLWKKAEVNLWNGSNGVEMGRYDMVFIDGPHGGRNRKRAFELSIFMSDLILIHDAWRGYEKRWKAKYLVDFKKVAEGGSLCLKEEALGAPYCELWKINNKEARKRLDEKVKKM